MGERVMSPGLQFLPDHGQPFRNRIRERLPTIHSQVLETVVLAMNRRDWVD